MKAWGLAESSDSAMKKPRVKSVPQGAPTTSPHCCSGSMSQKAAPVVDASQGILLSLCKTPVVWNDVGYERVIISRPGVAVDDLHGVIQQSYDYQLLQDNSICCILLLARWLFRSKHCALIHVQTLQTSCHICLDALCQAMQVRKEHSQSR